MVAETRISWFPPGEQHDEIAHHARSEVLRRGGQKEGDLRRVDTGAAAGQVHSRQDDPVYATAREVVEGAVEALHEPEGSVAGRAVLLQERAGLLEDTVPDEWLREAGLSVALTRVDGELPGEEESCG